MYYYCALNPPPPQNEAVRSIFNTSFQHYIVHHWEGEGGRPQDEELGRCQTSKADREKKCIERINSIWSSAHQRKYLSSQGPSCIVTHQDPVIPLSMTAFTGTYLRSLASSKQLIFVTIYGNLLKPQMNL
jgi:hypothetical protein